MESQLSPSWLVAQTIPECNRPSFDSERESPANSLPSTGPLADWGVPAEEEHLHTSTLSSCGYTTSSTTVNGSTSHVESSYAVSGNLGGDGSALQPSAQVSRCPACIPTQQCISPPCAAGLQAHQGTASQEVSRYFHTGWIIALDQRFQIAELPPEVV